MRGKRLFLGISIVLAIALASLAAFLYFSRDKNPIPKNIRSSTTFPLYYPEKVPQGWAIQKTSFTKTADVVMYRITNIDNPQKAVSISIQPQPKAFNFDKFYRETLAKSTQFTTGLGLAAIGEGENGYKIGSISTGDSWILITSNSNHVANSDLRALLSSLRN